MISLILLGPPGAGKGTLAAEIRNHFLIPHISTGMIFRNAIENHSTLGDQIDKLIQGGNLVPDEITIPLVKERLAEPDTRTGYILDGFPRTIPQAEALEKFANIALVFNLQLSREEIIRRLSGRRTCPNCGEIYHIYHKPPQKPEICDRCGSVLIIRPDDQEESILNRLDVYEHQTAPLVSFYEKRGLSRDLDCHRPAPEIWEDAKRIIHRL